MPLFVIILIVVVVVAGALAMVRATWKIEQREKAKDRAHEERMLWQKRFWSIVNSINWNDDEWVE